MNDLARKIQSKAYELGYEKCGIVPLEAIEEYKLRLEERMRKVPASAGFYERQKRLTEPEKAFPWAKSVVVVSQRYGKYEIPENFSGRIGKFYLFDTRTDENTEEFQSGSAFENYMKELGLEVVTERKFGLIGLRWAAMTAGLGTIRRNNFFYTDTGSWSVLYAWLIDAEMEIKDMSNLPKCPPSCNRCVEACPTNSLSEEYTMNPATCISFLTTAGPHDLLKDPNRKKFQNCLYGCDICQDVCPMNAGKWELRLEFPGLSAFAEPLLPEAVMEMDETYFRETIQPKLYYLSPNDLWKLQINALCYMENNYEEKYRASISAACGSENEKVRGLAQDIRVQVCPAESL